MSVGKYGIPPLTSHNWAVWKPKVKGLLRSKGVLDALTDAQHADSSKALGLIQLLMDDTMLSVTHDIDNCKDAWDAYALTALFASQSTANALQLKRKHNNLSMKGKESVASYFQRGRKLQFELDAADVAVEDSELVICLLPPEACPLIMTSPSASSSTQNLCHPLQQY